MKRLFTLITTTLCLACTAVPAAADNAITGIDIARKIKESDRGWGDMSANLKMLLKDDNGSTSQRAFSLITLEMKNDGDRSLAIFSEPADIKGTSFLSFSHALEPDQQWLYLPALRRVKRISSHNKSGKFLGSEFSYEDLASFEVEKYKYELLREESLEGTPHYVLRLTPRYEHSGYSYQDAWVNKETFRITKTKYYDRKRVHLKTLVRKNFDIYLGKHWRASSFDMKNHQSGKSTLLEWRDFEFQRGLETKDFSRNAMKRGL